jgi:2,3-dihydroxybiphenyl 1,2-dioxygenase
MQLSAELGYLGLDVSDLAAWRLFAEDILGLSVGEARADGSLPLRMDGRSHRFLLREGAADDVAYLGWQVADPAELAALRQHLAAAGIAVADGTAQEAAARGVAALIHFRDPDGLRLELFHGPEIGPAGWRSEKMASGYHTDAMGMGHVLMNVRNLAETERFWRDTLGFRLSDTVVADFMGNDLRAIFLHVNPRHHSLAIAQLPGYPKRLQHFMLEVNALDDVGLALDRCQQQGVPIALSLGRHQNDRMVSFYGVTPSGFLFEVGWGAVTVDDDSTWETRTYRGVSDWGHRPQVPPPKAA